MVVFNQPFSGQLVVDVPRGVVIQSAELVGDKQKIEVVETTTNQYHINAPKKLFKEPYVIRLTVTEKNKTKKYRESLT